MSAATASVNPEALPSEFNPELGVGELFDAIADPEWVLPCRSADADLWFAEKTNELERAKQLCVDCPIRSACLAGAVDRREPWGVWGGEIFERGAVIAKKRSRGRPRKNVTVQTVSGATIESRRPRQTVAA